MNFRSAAHGQKQSSVAVAVHRALGSASATLLVLAASLATGTAGAQEQQASAPSDVLQEITVTGSRIQRADGYEAPTPVSVQIGRAHV